MTLILYNPKAHNGAGEQHARDWATAHHENPENMRSLLTVENLTDLVSLMGEDDKIVLLGGDGTLNRFADAIRDLDVKVPIYFAAAGTGNDFLIDVQGKPAKKSHEDDEPILINQYITNLPIVIINGEERVFVNGVGFGLDGWCCEVGDEMQRTSDKPVKYSSIAISGLLGKFNPRNATITVDGVTREYHKVWLAPVMNGRYYGGGIMITPEQDRLSEDGLVSAAVVHNSGRIHTFLSFPGINKGKHTKKKKIFEAYRGDEITVKFDVPCALQVDGETYLNISEYSVLSRRAVAARRAEAKKAKETVATSAEETVAETAADAEAVTAGV